MTAHFAGGKPLRTPRGALPVACVSETGYASSESTIAVTDSGAIFYSPANTENTLARSFDRGKTWNLVQPQVMQYTSLWNTVDPFVTVDRRTGRVFWAHVTGPTRTTPVLVDESPIPYGLPTAFAFAYGFQVYSSANEGRTWTTADYQTAPMTDWEKLFVGPPPAKKTGAAQPSGYPNVVYICANSPFEVIGPGRLCYKSLDGAKTFTIAGYQFPSSSAPNTCAALNTNVAVVTNDGTIYQPVTCSDGSYLAMSRDEGASYDWIKVPGVPGANGIPGGIGFQVAADTADNLYVIWETNDQFALMVSRTRGRTWSKPLSLAPRGLHNITFPALAAGPRGALGVTYYASQKASVVRLTAYITQTRSALASRPIFYSGALNDPKHPILQDYGFNSRPRVDFVGGTFDRSGTFWAGVVKQLGPPDSDGDIATTGYVGRLTGLR